MAGPRLSFLREERGWTLTELMVTLALFGMIMIGVIATWSKAQEAYFVGSEVAEIQQNVRAAIDFMLREFRSVGRDVTVCAFDYLNPVAGVAGDCNNTAPFDKIAACQAKLLGNWNNPNGAPAVPGADAPGPGCQGLYAVPYNEATLTTIRIRSDRNDNGRIVAMGNSDGTDGAEEDVKYALTAASPPCPTGVAQCITRDDGTGPQAMVAVDISGFELYYYPRPGFGPCVAVGGVIPNPCPQYTLPFTTQQDADNIARIRVVVRAQQTTAGATLLRTMTTDVLLKNRS